MRALAWLVLAIACGGAHALTQDEVLAGAKAMYDARIAAIARRHALDADAHFLARATRIAQRLAAQAARDHPESARWSWELHTTTDSDENASCMAGGKLLLGQPFADSLELDDAELAMVLAHEMQHALLQHNLQEYAEALRLDPSWRARPFAELETAVDHDPELMRQLEPLNFAQEREADREGMLLAVRTGWRATRLAGYFRKLARASRAPNFDSATHPAPAARWQAARALAARLDK